MNHPAELAVYSFLQLAMQGKAKMSNEVAAQVASDVEAALEKQFNSGPRDEFRLRMSNIGRYPCQLQMYLDLPGSPASSPLLMLFLYLSSICNPSLFIEFLSAWASQNSARTTPLSTNPARPQSATRNC